MTNEYIMALDEGTTSTRAIILDHAGHIVADARREFTQYFPQAGWVEHNANEIWSAVLATIADAVNTANIEPQQIKAMGITNQRETTIIWDKKTGLPIYNAVVWQSRQSAELANDLIAAGYESQIHQKTGLKIDAYFSATKIRWILDHVPHAQERAERGELLFGTIDTWLIWKLTGGEVHATDYTNASRTMLFNIHDLKWDQDILNWLQLPASLFPEVHGNSEFYGVTKAYHFYGSEIPITGVAGDQQAALIGQLAFQPGMVKNTYGTGSFMVMNTGITPIMSQNQLLTTIAYQFNGPVHYALEGSVFVSGSALQWLRDQVHLIKTAPDSEQAAWQSRSHDEIYVVPAFTGLGAPYWDSQARGAIFGLTRGTTDKDLIKATLQSLAYQTRDVVETMNRDTGLPIPLLRVDGGAAQNNYLVQFQADILNIPLERAHNLETTALGASFLAGLAVGFWQNQEELETLFAPGHCFNPKMAETQRQRLYQGWQYAVQATQFFSHPH